ncbi:MAG TPA: class I SAM-dependent methyltransferase [Sedimentisphaerales bacterium]|nr:class I SAM-dependent methyltransferase [Sedimentisphaerales bacterium]
MMELLHRFYLLTLILLFCGAGCFNGKPLSSPSDEKYTEQNAFGMIRTSRKALAPVYAPLAEQIVSDFDLAEKEGIGIDLGSGPGTLIVELCKRTRMHWINADINPNFFPNFYRQAEENGSGYRVSAIFADAHNLPFRDNYADIIVSRGSYHFWEDKVRAFSEIYRVLKPGAVAYIGRGFSRNLPVETAEKIRAKQGKKMQYDVRKKANELYSIMKTLGIKDYRIDIPKPPGSKNVNYGIWIEFRKTGENVDRKRG